MQPIKIKAKFSKQGLMRYISHLDFIRLIYRSLRRGMLPFVLTQGFNPRPKVKFGQALKLGDQGEVEVLFYLGQELGLDDFKLKIEKQIIKDIRILELDYE
jgi:radical SAM-linked protein